MPWIQTYDPLGNQLLSTLVAALPIVLLLGLLASGRASAQMAALAGLTSALLIAIFVYVPDMAVDSYWEAVSEWAPSMFAAAGNGAAFGLLPIGWIVFAAIFLYSLTVESGQFDIVKQSVASVSNDRRIQALLIAFSFGAFVEGAAGFGTPVAISAALMMGLGFRPLYAAGLALLANTSPVAFGALGTPILTLGEVTGLDPHVLSAMAGRQLPFFSLIVPVWLVCVMSGWRGVVGCWPALLVCGGIFAVVQFAMANYAGPELVDVAGGLASLIGLALFLRIWKPATIWRFADEEADDTDKEGENNPQYTRKQTVTAWMPWVVLTVFVFVWGLDGVKKSLNQVSMPVAEVPALHKKIARGERVDKRPLEERIQTAEYKFGWLSATGTAIFLAAVISALMLRISARRFLAVFFHTLYRTRWPLFTIACMLAIALVTKFSGMDATLGLAFTYTGAFYPLFAAMIGWLGVALTGSDTSSNALFGSLQTITADQLTVEGGALQHLSEHQGRVLMATANSTGGVMGKMIDAQSIVVAAVATQQHGQEGAILRFVFWHSVILALMMGLLVLAQAYWLSWMIPG